MSGGPGGSDLLPAAFEAPASTPRPWGTPITVGVLGGMGPYATLEFMKNVLDLTPARRDWEHVRMVVDSNCHIPSRTRAVLYGEASPLPGMLDSCRRLMQYPVDVIALPCNSACHWLPELRRRIKTPILDIVSIATTELFAAGGGPRVTALGGAVPYHTNLYQGPIEARGGTYVKLDPDDQQAVVAEIEAVKSSGRADAAELRRFESFVARLAASYALDGVILACTEFSFLRDAAFTVPAVDSSRALARVVVEYAVHGKPLELDVTSIKEFWDRRAALIDTGGAGLLQSTMLTASEEEAARRLETERAALWEVLAPRLSRSARVLELGCGAGRWSRILAAHVAHVDAWDYSAGLIDVARRETARAGVDNVTFHVGAVERMQADDEYDAVVSVALLHYLDERQFLACMNLVRNSVAAGGYAVFRETFGTSRRFELHGFHSDTLDSAYHAVYRTPSELAARLGDGFELILHQTTLAPTKEKPETQQGLLLFQRRRA